MEYGEFQNIEESRQERRLIFIGLFNMVIERGLILDLKMA
jgi:hypothetical protein